MDLQQQPGGQSRLAQRGVHPDHRHLDDVGGAALDRGVERGPLRGLPELAVAAVQLRQVAATAQHRRGVAVLAGLIDDTLQIVPDPTEPGEVGIHLLLGLLGGDLELGCQPVGAQSVGQPVGHRFDPAAQFRGDLVDRHAERPRSDERMQVLAGVEGLDEALVLGQVRHDAHLDLAVVGGQQLRIAVTHTERVPDPAPGLGADRDVLQVRLGRGQPAGGRDRLVERGMNPAIRGRRFQQPIDGDLESGGVAVDQHVFEERVAGLIEQALQSIGIRGVAGLGLLRLRHAEFVEQHHLKLLGRTEVDLLADHRIRGLRGVPDRVAEFALQRLELVGVDGDARGLHGGQRGLHRQFHLTQQRHRVDTLQLDVQSVGEVGNRPGPQDQRLHGLVVDAFCVVEQRKLLLFRGFRS